MRAHILTIGDEILIGQIVNTNAAYIGAGLVKHSIDVTGTSVTGDSPEAILKEFAFRWSDCDVLIVTGGLGPTHDDVTKDCICRFFDTRLVLNEEVLTDVKNLFNRRGMASVMAAVNETQAYVPAGATVIRNPKGTAPGIWIRRDNKVFVAMPGVPFEMKEMMETFVIPELLKLDAKRGKLRLVKNLLTTGIAESSLFERLGNIDQLLGGAKLAFLPNQFGVRMRITVEDKDENLANNRLSGIEQAIRSKVGRYIYGTEDQTLEGVIARLLTERGLTLALAESCTGGLISHRLTNISGSSKYFERGVISYSNGAKVELLKVDEDKLIQHGAVSLEVAQQMAAGIKAVSGTDLGLAITGILGPTGATPEKPIGLVFVGICDDNICTAKEFRFGDDRIINKDKAAQAALDMLRRHILGISYDE
ncbi:MAG: competence/damage-inducible protein A [Bacteroidota bacterium]